MPSILDILNQGGQFLAGRQQQQAQNAQAREAMRIAEEERRQKAALQEALMAQYAATADHTRALAERNRFEMGKPPVVTEDQYEGAAISTFKPDRSTAENVSQTFANFGVQSGMDPRTLMAVTQRIADERAKPKPLVPGSPEALAALDAELDVRDQHETPAGGAGGRPQTVAQRTAKMLYTSGLGGYEALEKVLEESGKEAPGWLEQQASKIPFGIGNVVTTPYMRQMEQAANQLSDAWLRLTSGAAVPEPEVARFAKGFLPLAGDANDPITSANKKRARATIIEAMRAAAGAPGLDIPTGLAEAGISPTDYEAVAEWIQANTGGGVTGSAVQGPAVGGNRFEQNRRARQGGG